MSFCDKFNEKMDEQKGKRFIHNDRLTSTTMLDWDALRWQIPLVVRGDEKAAAIEKGAMAPGRLPGYYTQDKVEARD
jgi:hypothetical protein